MDPVAHSLAGATIAQTGLNKLTPLGTLTLVIGANLPDIDVIAHFFGSDKALLYRRGLTHGILAMVVLPILLTISIVAYDKFRRLPRNPQAKPVQAHFILLLSAIGIWSHPLLDWLNTYGVRLLSPFDNRWFYGDSLFIIDVWMWLLMAASVVFAYSSTRFSQFLWVILGIATSSIVALTDFVPSTTKYLWFVGIGAIALVRERWQPKFNNQYVAMACLSIFMTYLALMGAGNSVVEQTMRNWVAAKHEAEGGGNTNIEKMMVGPVPGNPLYREVIIRTRDHYFGVRTPIFDFFDVEKQGNQELFEPVKIKGLDSVEEQALAQKGIEGFTNWMRFPIFSVESNPNGAKITIRDLRYVRPDQQENRGIGMISFIVP